MAAGRWNCGSRISAAFRCNSTRSTSRSASASIGPESADVVTTVLTPQAAGKLAVADALAAGRSISYALTGTIAATPDEAHQRSFEVKHSSQLSPAPGLPGVLR
jgi:ABC-type phosphate transport system permease subunit